MSPLDQLETIHFSIHPFCCASFFCHWNATWMSYIEGAVSSVQSWMREYLGPVLQLNTWKTLRQLPVSACFNWFTFCSSWVEMLRPWKTHTTAWCPGPWCHGELASSWTGGTNSISAQHYAQAVWSFWESGRPSLGAWLCCSTCAACELFLSRFSAALSYWCQCAGLV